MEIIRKYEAWLTYWVSEPDRGQAHAINKGWQVASGQFVTWLNSDDTLTPASILTAMQYLAEHPDTQIVYGDVIVTDEQSRPLARVRGKPFIPERIILYAENPMSQPGFYMVRELLTSIGWLDENLQCAMDYDYWVRAAINGARGDHVERVLATFMVHRRAKNQSALPNSNSGALRGSREVFLEP